MSSTPPPPPPTPPPLTHMHSLRSAGTSPPTGRARSSRCAHALPPACDEMLPAADQLLLRARMSGSVVQYDVDVVTAATRLQAPGGPGRRAARPQDPALPLPPPLAASARARADDAVSRSRKKSWRAREHGAALQRPLYSNTPPPPPPHPVLATPRRYVAANRPRAQFHAPLSPTLLRARTSGSDGCTGTRPPVPSAERVRIAGPHDCESPPPP
jgi:hypothetical protein